jgi:hypothetical protein
VCTRVGGCVGHVEKAECRTNVFLEYYKIN